MIMIWEFQLISTSLSSFGLGEDAWLFFSTARAWKKRFKDQIIVEKKGDFYEDKISE